MEGKVEFKTRYETRTRILDSDGNELGAEELANLPAEELANAGVAPPHPDVEGVDSQTAKKADGDESVPPVKESVEGDHEAKAKAAKPASEKNEASSQS